MEVQIIQPTETGGQPQFAVIGGREGYRADASDYVETADGQVKHIFQEVELTEDGGGFDQAEYERLAASAVFGSVDNYAAVARWAQQNIPQQLLQDYNDRLTADGGELEAAFQWLLNEYQEAQVVAETIEDQPEETDEQALDEWFDTIPDDQLDEVLDELESTEFDESQVEQMTGLLENYEVGTPEYSILQAGLLVAEGRIEMADAIQYVCDELGESQAAAAYFKLAQYLS